MEGNNLPESDPEAESYENADQDDIGSMQSDESVQQKAKEKVKEFLNLLKSNKKKKKTKKILIFQLYFLTLETRLFTKQLQDHKLNYNVIDKNLAVMLNNAVDAISELLREATVQGNNEKQDVTEIISFVENDICQVHRSFYCRACNLNLRTSPKSFSGHFRSMKHLKKSNEKLIALKKAKGKSIQSKEQLLLNQQFKGSAQSVASSANSSAKKERLNSLPSSISQPKKPENLPQTMISFLGNSDLDNFSVALLSEGTKIYNSQVFKRVCNLLERRLIARYPKVKAIPFGSVVIGLGRPGGDLDIFIDIGDCFNTKPNKRQMKDAIHVTQRILKTNSMGKNQWEDFEAVTHARTPILKTYCCAEKIDCDLSFSNGLSCCNTSLIGYYITLQPVCRKIAAFMKFWFGKMQLGINSYMISLMIIYYLQQEQLLPSVQQLQDLQSPRLIDGWNTAFLPTNLGQLKMPLATDFMKYLIGFFYFYGWTFNYENHIVSILTGTPIDKSIFNHGKENDLPPVFDRYKAYMESINLDEADEVEDLFANYKPFVIQDPFELCHNVAKGVQTQRLLKIINYMRLSYEIISKR